MRVAVLTEHYYEDAFGGAEYRISLLARELVKSGHQVYYVCTSPDGAVRCSEGIHVLPLRTKVYSRRLGRNYFLYKSAIFRALDSIQPDVIYQSVASAITGIAALYAKRTGCKMVWHIAHERDVRPVWLGSLHTAAFDYIDKRWTEYGIRSADTVIGQARYQDRLLRDNYGRSCDLIVGNSHPVPTEQVVKTGPTTVVWVANLKPFKQPEVFLRLVREMGDCDHVRFIMIGRPASGRYQRRLDRGMVGLENFSYTGERPIQEVNRILARSHIFVNTSRDEGFPNTFIQAWFRKVPVVSLNVDPDNILKKTGIGFHSRSFGKLIEDTKRLVRDARLRRQMGLKAKEYAARYHSIEVGIPRILALLES